MNENTENLNEIVISLLKARRFSALRERLLDMKPVDIAVLFEELPDEDVPLVYRILPKEFAAEAFVSMDPDMQERLILAFNDNELRAVLDEMYLDDTVDMVEEMPANVVKRILAHTSPQTRHMINEILKYPDDSAGSIMTIEYVDLKKDMTVSQAFDKIRKTGIDKETVYTCYVKDNNRRLLGVITVKTMLLAPQDEIIGDLMETNIIYVDTDEDKEVVARMFDKYDFLAMPVVDKEGRLVGIITVDDAMDVIQEENSEDFAKMAAITPSEESYLKTPVWRHAKNRIVWLLLLMLSATITGSILTYYESAFKAIPLLVAFIPMLMGTGGNCGSQSSVMIIRGLSMEDIQLKDFFRVVAKEAGIALICGIILGAVNFVRIMIFYNNVTLAVVLGLTLLGIVFIAKIIGALLPMGAKLIHLDPAVMAAPLLTTITDTCSVLLYFAIAKAAFGL